MTSGLAVVSHAPVAVRELTYLRALKELQIQVSTNDGVNSVSCHLTPVSTALDPTASLGTLAKKPAMCFVLAST